MEGGICGVEAARSWHVMYIASLGHLKRHDQWSSNTDCDRQSRHDSDQYLLGSMHIQLFIVHITSQFVRRDDSYHIKGPMALRKLGYRLVAWK